MTKNKLLITSGVALLIVIVIAASVWARNDDTAAPLLATTTSSTSSTSTTTPTTTSTSSATSTPITKTPTQMPKLVGSPPSAQKAAAEKLQLMGGDLNDYWASQFATYPRFKSHKWTPVPELHIGFEPAACGLDPDFLALAFYCPSDYVAMNLESFATTVDENTGKSVDVDLTSNKTLFFTIAHEWGHAVQHKAVIDLATTAAESQADCYAGMFLRHALDKGLFPKSDLDKGLLDAVARSYGDNVLASDLSGDHGNGSQRQASFDQGWNATSPSACAR